MNIEYAMFNVILEIKHIKNKWYFCILALIKSEAVLYMVPFKLVINVKLLFLPDVACYTATHTVNSIDRYCDV